MIIYKTFDHTMEQLMKTIVLSKRFVNYHNKSESETSHILFKIQRCCSACLSLRKNHHLCKDVCKIINAGVVSMRESHPSYKILSSAKLDRFETIKKKVKNKSCDSEVTCSMVDCCL